MLSMERVPKCTSIQVTNIGSISEDSLSAYFGSTKKSGGSGDPDVTIDRDQGCAIVSFETPESKTINCLQTVIVNSDGIQDFP